MKLTLLRGGQRPRRWAVLLLMTVLWSFGPEKSPGETVVIKNRDVAVLADGATFAQRYTRRELVELAVKLRLSLKGADLRGANLRGANLRGADLAEALLSGADLTSATLDHANLTSATLNSATLTSVTLDRTNLSSADLRRATLRQVWFKDVKLERTQLIEADLSKTTMTAQAMRYCNLDGANMRYTVLHGVRIEDSYLRGADLTSAVLTSATLARVNLEHAVLMQTELHGTVYEPKGQPDPDQIARAYGLKFLKYKESKQGLLNLIKGLRDNGYYQQERDVTYALKHAENELRWHGVTRTLKRWNPATCSMEVVMEHGKPVKVAEHHRVEYLFNWLLFDWPSRYGAEPERLLWLFLGQMILGGAFYFGVIRLKGASVKGHLLFMLLPLFFFMGFMSLVLLLRQLKLLQDGQEYQWMPNVFMDMGFGGLCLIWLIIYGLILLSHKTGSGIARINLDLPKGDPGYATEIQHEQGEGREAAMGIVAPSMQLWWTHPRHSAAETTRQFGRWLAAEAHTLKIGLQFSIFNTLKQNFRWLEAGSWLRMMQSENYELRARKVLCPIAAIQALVGFYLLAMWVLTYFGRPFSD